MSSYSRILFGNNLKYLRNKNSLNQKELADKLQVSQNTVSNWEQGNREPDSIELFLEICKIFEVTLDELIKSDLQNSRFTTIDEATLFLISNPVVSAYGGYDLDKMTNEEKIQFANKVAGIFKIISEEYKNK